MDRNGHRYVQTYMLEGHENGLKKCFITMQSHGPH